MHKKFGVFIFITICFVSTYVIELIMILKGFSMTIEHGFTVLHSLSGMSMLAVITWLPAISAFAAGEGLSGMDIRFGRLSTYIYSMFLIPACFILIYLVTWFLGIGHPDWQLTHFWHLSININHGTLNIPPPKFILPVLFLFTIFISPFIFSLFAFGEELGWRGYLMPKLMPLGKKNAYIIIGIIWGLWNAPMIFMGLDYPGHPVLGILMMIALTTSLGIYLNEMRLKHSSSVLASWIHGLINSQVYGVWLLLFPKVNPLLGGITGIVGIAIFFLLGILVVKRFSISHFPG